jgi:D-2-hydroxyacid dehydrogenase (NADP+)
MKQKRVNLVIVSPIGEEAVGQIARLEGQVQWVQASPLIRDEKKGDPQAREKMDSILTDAEVLYGWIWHLPFNFLARAPRLKWIQVMSAGVDRLAKEILQSRVLITNAGGVHAIPIGEFVLYLMLSLAKQAARCFAMKEEKSWKRFRAAVLHSQTVGIVGLGHIGREVARLAKGFGMKVIATRYAATKRGGSRYVDQIYPRSRLQDLLAESDFVVLAIPLTAETKGLIGEAEFRAMKPRAYFINVARGEIVDEEALIRALEENRIAGAGLDVFATEPPPPESKIWTLPNVLYSPHVAGEIEDYERRATEILCENLRRFSAGKKLINLVDPKKGY